MDIGQAYAQAGGNKVKTVIKTGSFAFDGGINVMDAPTETAPGQLLGCLNYEPGVRGGYRRFDGYERFDGQNSPSDSDFVAIKVPVGYTPPIGMAVGEPASGATGLICYIDTINSFIVVTAIDGVFLCRGNIISTAYGDTNSIGVGYLNGGVTDEVAAMYYLQKYIYLQTFINPVGGSSSQGPVRGAFPYLNSVYAVRDDVGGASASLWRSSSAGWQPVNLGFKVRYKAGVYAAETSQPPEGTTLVGATSGTVFTIKRLITQSGVWGTDAAGYFIVSVVQGSPVANELLKDVSGTTYCTFSSVTAQDLQPGGLYHFRCYNFNASQDPLSGFRLYGVSGVDYGFEYDAVADTFVQIETGMQPDKPTHLEVHSDHLFYAYPGGSLQNSSYQMPTNWEPVFGADARSVGEDVTFMREDVSSTLVIGTRRRVWSLTGLVVESFQIKVFSANTGSIELTDEMPGQIMFMEDRGFTTLAASAAYGNFEASSLSDKILDLATQLMESDRPVGAVVTRKKNLYRIVFASGRVLCLGINAQGKFGGWTSGQFLVSPYAFYGGFSQAITNGPQVERSFLCGVDGYLYETDKGRSFDGQNIRHFLRLAYFDAKSPDVFKRWRRLQVDLLPEGIATMSVSIDYDYGNRSGQGNAPPLDFIGNGGFWDIATWDQFTWSAAQYSQAVMKVEGEGYNIGLFFAGNSNNEQPMTLYNASCQYTPRVINRNTRDG